MLSVNTNNLATSREPIFQAIFDLVKTTEFEQPVMGYNSFQGSVRKYLDPDQIPPDQLPFLCQYEGYPEEVISPGIRLPSKRFLGVRLFCWAKTAPGNDGELGSSYLNWMYEGIEASLASDTSGYGSPGLLTLGGLVQWCAIEGTVLRAPGDTDNLAMICIPIRVLWPDTQS